MEYVVRTISTDNRVASLTISARDEADARAQLAQRGLVAASLRLRKAPLPAWNRGERGFELVLFSQELLALLNAGLSVVEALEALVEKESQPAAVSVLSRLLAGLREGRRLSAALAEQPQVFPPLFVGMVRTAEGTSDLPRSLSRFVEYEMRLSVVRNKVVSAAIYPSILMLVGGAVTLFLVGFVVPRFAEVFQGTGRQLPWLSRQMLDAGQWVSSHGMLVLVLVVAALLAAITALQRVMQRVGLAGLLAVVPGLAQRIRVFELSRLYLTLGMLIEGGIPIVGAIDIVHGIVSPGVRDALRASKARIESGLSLSSAFEAHGLTTPISLRLLRVGERTGNMGQLLVQSATFYDGEISRWIDRFTRSFEPLLMAVIGVVVGAIVVMLYMPIFDLAGEL